MAVTFSDLHTERGLKTLEEHLAGKTYISGDQLSVDDVKVYAAVLENPGDGFPNASKWYDSVASHLAKSFPGKADGVRVGGGVAPPSEAHPHTEEPAADGDGDDDDDIDLFADETEDEKKAAEEREAAKKDTKKTKESGKSSVLLEVKPWDDETDMKKLEEAVRSVQMPGLTWGASKLVPVGYGIKKLTIMMTIVDDLVSVDNLIEDHLTSEPNNEYIQSVDIVAFNKI
ncbi:putative translation elongation factor EF1B/ribosomal protein S6 [Arabidopsis thaliana]|jgi:elongation factor 1-beta|uniref:Elongation factor 1-beta 1 n=5 Tax=Arabidopsis TaxID=3701 RepID=EF1B1_ARATH|nr:elongation factor 1-beta 1 [Arabidopsis thaliana]Q84WM9.2 RecName: Full=Elongation factor 1-beta 1; Short=EF-1-beta 1; AltName: Full=Elongation factor 1-beta' 1; Short=EF-1-beta' 1; AltName: Full=Elongation factor 1B-alpha 1; AltName: Full=eEF-1B alpha 1 [Arabidopsis thaliana]KAG7602000.1 Translation elongation factor eEF-1beta-like superfamily [Arabidopsis thaliana x Arabidopsis arenosa]KAG7608953.1 Translation elongation factor eEF-1beta-like superfamily [Arabidopsis suecica]ABD59112.1 At5|eukprot:NP_196772.1 elongation factor 1-beta 1 [Arabidopsis thaliana]